MDFLRELFSEPLSFEAFSKAVQEKGVKLADLSTGKYADIEAKEDAAKKEAEDKALTDAITALFGERKFTSDYARDGLIADMKGEIAKPENKGKGYAELFEAITKDKEGIFANPNPPADMTGMGTSDTEELDKYQSIIV